MSEKKLRPDLSRPFNWDEYKPGETPVCTRDGRAVGTIAYFPEVKQRDVVFASVAGSVYGFARNGLHYRGVTSLADLFFAEKPRMFTDEEVWAFAKHVGYLGGTANGAEFKAYYPIAYKVASYALAEIERAKRGEA